MNDCYKLLYMTDTVKKTQKSHEQVCTNSTESPVNVYEI